MQMLTERQAYAAMFDFLERIYQRTKSDDIGGLLGGMSVLADGSTADAAVQSDWRASVDRALHGKVATQQQLA